MKTLSSGKAYEDYYLRQVGQGLPVFAGASRQRGHGIGNLMKGLWRTATPLLAKAGKQALKTGVSVVASGLINPKSNKKKTKPNGWNASSVRTPVRRRSVSKTKKKSPSPRARQNALSANNFRMFSPLNKQTGSGRVTRKKRKTQRRSSRKRDIFQ